MKTEELKDRLGKVDDRVKSLWDKYPLVFVAVYALGAITGVLATLIVGTL